MVAGACRAGGEGLLTAGEERYKSGRDRLQNIAGARKCAVAVTVSRAGIV